MIDKLILFFTENGQGITFLLLSITVFLNSLNVKRHNERIANLEICMERVFLEKEEDQTIMNESIRNLEKRIANLENYRERVFLEKEEDKTIMNESIRNLEERIAKLEERIAKLEKGVMDIAITNTDLHFLELMSLKEEQDETKENESE